MFGRQEMEARIAELERKLAELTERLDKDGGVIDRIGKVEGAVEPFRVGPIPAWSYGNWKDFRPRVTVKDAISKIMAHLGMDFCVTPAKAEEVHLCKPKRTGK